jgi:5'-nucleotidase
MRALITNDDGIDSNGLRTLAQVARDCGLDVIIAAPESDSSGASASLSAVEADGHLLVEERELEGLSGVRALAVRASPALIAFVGARGAFGERPDIVLAGANHGPNIGHATLHSGTVGAALTAASNGQRAFALSVDSAAPQQWAAVRTIAHRVLSWWLTAGVDGTVLSLNVPDLPTPEIRGIRQAKLAPFGAVQARIGEPGEGYVSVTFTDIDRTADAETDAALLKDGWATATALRAPCESAGIDFSAVAEFS